MPGAVIAGLWDVEEASARLGLGIIGRNWMTQVRRSRSKPEIEVSSCSHPAMTAQCPDGPTADMAGRFMSARPGPATPRGASRKNGRVSAATCSLVEDFKKT
jgi:hypothetical protein